MGEAVQFVVLLDLFKECITLFRNIAIYQSTRRNVSYDMRASNLVSSVFYYRDSQGHILEREQTGFALKIKEKSGSSTEIVAGLTYPSSCGSVWAPRWWCCKHLAGSARWGCSLRGAGDAWRARTRHGRCCCPHRIPHTHPPAWQTPQRRRIPHAVNSNRTSPVNRLAIYPTRQRYRRPFGNLQKVKDHLPWR